MEAAVSPGDGVVTARYVAIITDGNGRWAQARGVPVADGHSAGADTVKARLRDAAELGIEEFTVYSFSTENWSRPATEVQGLMDMFSDRIARESPELDRGLLQPHKKLIGAFLPEILNHGVAFTEGTQCLAHLGNGHFLIKPDLNDGAAGKINTQVGAFE